MKQIDCKIAEDLMPLYAENLLLPGSTELLKEHLSSCHACREKAALFESSSFRSQTKENEITAPSRPFYYDKKIYLWGFYILGMIGITTICRGAFALSFPDLEKQMYFGIYAFAFHAVLFLTLSLLCMAGHHKSKGTFLVLLFSISFGTLALFSESVFPWYLILGGYPVVIGGILGYLIGRLRERKPNS